MDNQQEICEWARLAGLLMGDGHFSMIPYSNHKQAKSGFTAIRPMIGLTNQDASIIKVAADLYDKQGVKFYIDTRNGVGLSKAPITNILVLRFDSVKLLCENLIPWLVGDKQARAELLLRYVNKERRGRRVYDADDEDIIRAFAALSPKVKKGGPSRLTSVLRDYTQGSPIGDEDIVQSVAKSTGSSA